MKAGENTYGVQDGVLPPATAEICGQERDESRGVDGSGLDNDDHDRGQASRVDEYLGPLLGVPNTECDQYCL